MKRTKHPKILWKPLDKLSDFDSRGRNTGLRMMHCGDVDTRLTHALNGEHFCLRRDRLGQAWEKEDVDWSCLDWLRLYWTWRTTCAENHAICCQQSLTTSQKPAQSLWFIDTYLMCLVPTQSEHQYVTLNHVWGHVPFIKTLKGNIDQFQNPVLSRLRKSINRFHELCATYCS